MVQQTLKFSIDADKSFQNVLKQRVNTYFKQNNLSKHGGSKMIWKAIVMLSIYFVPFAVILLLGAENSLLFFLCWFVMGLGMAGLGLAVMHDGNHGAFSNKAWLNKSAGFIANLIGGHPTLWKIQHNVLHHTFTNVLHGDEDIDGPSFLRFTPHHPYKKIHRFQQFYAFAAYGLMTIGWCGWKDFIQAFRFKKNGLLTGRKFWKEFADLTFWKVFYFLYLMVLPIFVFNILWWKVLIGFLIMHFVCGWILSVIFQLAHVMPSSSFPLPNEEGVIEDNWAVHQLKTTANFSQKSKWFTWYVGGLNYQVEHHLFSNICHVHYPKISEIVKSTAIEFELPYYDHGSFGKAMLAHYNMLKNLGLNA